MTNKEAAETLKGEKWIGCAEKWNEAFKMAITAAIEHGELLEDLEDDECSDENTSTKDQ